MTTARTRRSFERGLTLVEVLVVCAIIAFLTVALVAGTGQIASARMKRSATMIASGVKVAYTRATSTSRSLRIVFDFEKSAIWLEESDVPMLVQSKDLAAGAAPITIQERAAIAEGDRILKGPAVPKPRFHPVSALGFGEQEGAIKGAKSLQRGITFKSVQTGHDDDPRTEGRAYLYFWPGGLTERASVQLRVGTSTEDKDALTLIVSPLTGKVTIKSGAVALVKSVDDKTDSEREDTAF